MIEINEKRFRGAVSLYRQTKLAEQLGISPQALHKKLKDLYRLRFREFNQICEILGETANEFITCKQKEALLNDSTPDESEN